MKSLNPCLRLTTVTSCFGIVIPTSAIFGIANFYSVTVRFPFRLWECLNIYDLEYENVIFIGLVSKVKLSAKNKKRS